MRIGPQSICGCYYVPSVEASNTKKYLPQVDLKAHTTVISTSSRTVLSQTFVNPSSTTDVNVCRYVFPLYDGVSVVGFTCQIGSRIIKGIVKEKTKAKEEYDAAVERGETAGLLEQGATSDVFMTSLGNIPAGEKLYVAITFIGELKYDVGADGIRFTIPTRISPRYGQARMNELDSTISKGGITITVDIKMPEDTPLQEVRSPSHPIAVTLGRTSAIDSHPPHLSRACATLSLGTSTLEKDFVLEIMHQDSGKSRALLENHPTIPGQRALMATLILNRPVQQSKPEIIFIADQSASMRGARTKTLVAALRVSLKSLPVGIKFNICYFGSSHSFIFPESQVYDQNSLEKALKSVEGLDGRYGGTETLEAIKASVESRDNEQPLSIILATDGDIWQQQELFDYLNESAAASKKALRVFALGIGDSVSSGKFTLRKAYAKFDIIFSALIEGVARAGNGFAQSVGEKEKLDGKVIRMLRGALTPDHGALTMEVQYQKDNDNEDEFVMVERVSDSLRVLGLDEDDWSDAQLGEEPSISAETTAAEKKDVEVSQAGGQARYDHLPTVPAPKLMQTPRDIPPLYAFIRTSVYVLISPEAAQGTIKSVTLKGSSAEKSFELEVPIEVLSERGETIHQLAAKKAVTELEEGRSWLVCAKDEKGVFIKEKHSGRFQSMVESEAVRLGIQYQIAGKFTSFVATETVSEDPKNTALGNPDTIGGADPGPSRIYTWYHQPVQPLQPTGISLSSASTSGAAFSASTSGALFSGPTRLFSASMSPPRKALSGSGSDTLGAMASFRSATSTKQALSAVPSRSRFNAGPAGNAPIDNEKTDPLQTVIALQTFEGCWVLVAPLLEVVGLSAQHKAPQDVDSKVWATVLAITYLEGKMAGDREAWVMVVEKGREWLKDMDLEEKWTLAKQLIMGTD